MLTYAHFCYKMVHCGIWDKCIVGFVRPVSIGGYVSYPTNSHNATRLELCSSLLVNRLRRVYIMPTTFAASANRVLTTVHIGYYGNHPPGVPHIRKGDSKQSLKLAKCFVSTHGSYNISKHNIFQCHLRFPITRSNKWCNLEIPLQNYHPYIKR